jgi:hypothetical protein
MEDEMKRLIIFLTMLFSIIWLSAQTQEWYWARQAGGANMDSGKDIARDSQGNLYVTGSFVYSATFGNYTLTTQLSSFFVAKMSPSGTWQWAVAASGSNNSNGNSIALDTAGNIYIAGTYSVSLDISGYHLTSNGSDEVFAAKFSNNGSLLWISSAGGTGFDRGNGITVGNNSQVFICGECSASASFGSYNLLSGNAFVAKLSSTDGSWLGVLGIAAGACNAIAKDSGGNLCVTGDFNTPGAYYFGSIYVYGSVYTAKLDSNLNWIWAKGTNGNHHLDIAVDSSDNVFVTGYFMGTITYSAPWPSPHTLTSAGGYDIYILKFNSAGTGQWVRRAGSSDNDMGYGVTADNGGNVYITGYFAMNADFGSFTLATQVLNGTLDIFVAKLSSTGTWLWAKRAGGSNSEIGYSICSDENSNLYLTGNFSGYVEFGSSWVYTDNYTNTDIFVSELINVVPKSPANIQIAKNGNDIQLSWTAVTQYTNNQPLVPDYYLVYYATEPRGTYSLLGLSVGTTYTHTGGASSARRFYLLTTVKN